ncbi:TPA: hypothetical protein ACFNMU_001078 [Neisseria lactamica]
MTAKMIFSSRRLQMPIYTEPVAVRAVYDYIYAENVSSKQLMWRPLIHLCFLASVIAMALTDKIAYGTTHKPH